MTTSAAGTPAATPTTRPLSSACLAADTSAGTPLLVAVTGPGDVAGSLFDAAGRAAAQARPLVLVVIREAAPLTINAVVHALAARRRAEEITSLTRAARVTCRLAGVEVSHVAVMGAPVRLTRAGRQRAQQEQLEALARSVGAELHPVGGLDTGARR